MKINVNVLGFGDVEVDNNTTLRQLSKKLFQDTYKKYLGARINNQIYNLREIVKEGMEIKFLDYKDVDGYRIYTKTITAIYIMVCKELYPDARAKINHFIGSGLYVELEPYPIRSKELQAIQRKMEEIIDKDYEIKRERYSKKEAVEIFKEQGYTDKVRLFNSINSNNIGVYKIDNHIDSFHGYLAPSTGYISEFKLKYYYPGALILYPSRKNNYDMDNFMEQNKLGKVFAESSRWLDILDLAHVGSLNEKIINGDIIEAIKVSEALHEKKIAQIADDICKDNDHNIILISGPSS